MLVAITFLVKIFLQQVCIIAPGMSSNIHFREVQSNLLFGVHILKPGVLNLLEASLFMKAAMSHHFRSRRKSKSFVCPF